MSDSLDPAWAKQKQTDKEASLLIERTAPEFWTALQEKLDIAADAVSEHNLSGLATVFGGGLRVTINRPGKAFSQTYTDLMFKRGMAEIRCTTLNNGTYHLQFRVAPDNRLVVVSSQGSEPMNAEQASEYVVQRMLEVIDRK